MNRRKCRFCQAQLNVSFVDLGLSPLSNAFTELGKINGGNRFYPLHVYVCEQCFLVQLEEFESPQDIFGEEYAYFSSFSESWLQHAKEYVDNMIERYSINSSSKVVEIACNDGYLLQYFKERNVPVIGIEPAGNVAEEARKKGIPVVSDFFGEKLAELFVARGEQADLIIGNNVLAHVPDINDFVKGLKRLLKDGGLITIEFPHLLALIQENQFDTIYHEHFSYFSLSTVQKIFSYHGLTVFHVEKLLSHGGSLRIYARHKQDFSRSTTTTVDEIIKLEKAKGLQDIETYRLFFQQVEKTKRNILAFLIQLKNEGKRIVGYGAPAKGNTLLNYCGIRSDFIDYVVDINPYKQGLLLPGSLISIYEPERIRETKPDIIVIMPWNIKEEVMEQMSYVHEWGGEFAVFIPNPKVLKL
ncbi:Methyltransferase domain-containing protein [Paenibacillus tianmuensis]|uniref:Methyltransferase domain-containing protein n=1 Tax=Paenibacillus tianmuensis TaxID=624147 RepID=A0A1G4RPF3_9BACL|nr:class I SAM-dependent methyltransferase [Paenibacillus tianmuensis]SCW58676.1 Methyltransferase domain-containing protein [Paenibacillus tianmuensis]